MENESTKELIETLWQRALRFLSFRSRSEAEIKKFLRLKLKKKKIKGIDISFFSPFELEKIVNQVIDNLKSEKLVNDEEFTRWWINQRSDFNPKGKLIIAWELRQKGIDPEIIEKELAKISLINQEQNAFKIILKKINLYKGLDKNHLRKKLLEHLLRRGFEFNLSKNIIDDFLKKDYNMGKK